MEVMLPLHCTQFNSKAHTFSCLFCGLVHLLLNMCQFCLTLLTLNNWILSNAKSPLMDYEGWVLGGGGALVAGGNSNSNGPRSQRRSKVWCGYSNYVEMGRRGVMGHNGRSFHGAKYPWQPTCPYGRQHMPDFSSTHTYDFCWTSLHSSMLTTNLCNCIQPIHRSYKK